MSLWICVVGRQWRMRKYPSYRPATDRPTIAVMARVVVGGHSKWLAVDGSLVYVADSPGLLGSIELGGLRIRSSAQLGMSQSGLIEPGGPLAVLRMLDDGQPGRIRRCL